MASVSVDDVCDVIDINSVDIPDSRVLKMVKRAEVTLELELGKGIDYNDYTDAKKIALAGIVEKTVAGGGF